MAKGRYCADLYSLGSIVGSLGRAEHQRNGYSLGRRDCGQPPGERRGVLYAAPRDSGFSWRRTVSTVERVKDEDAFDLVAPTSTPKSTAAFHVEFAEGGYAGYHRPASVEEFEQRMDVLLERAAEAARWQAEQESGGQQG